MKAANIAKMAKKMIFYYLFILSNIIFTIILLLSLNIENIGIPFFFAIINYILLVFLFYYNLLKIFRPSRTVFLSFSLVWFGIIPLANIGTGIYPWGYALSGYTQIFAIFMFNIGLFFYYLGYGTNSYKSLTINNNILRKYRMYIIFIIVIFLLLLSRYGIKYFSPVVRLSGDENELMSSGLENSLVKSVNISIIKVLSVILLLSKIIQNKQFVELGIGKKVNSIYMIIIAIMCAYINNPITTTRYFYGTIILSVIYLLLFNDKINSRLIFSFTLSIGLLILYTLGTNRVLVPIILGYTSITEVLIDTFKNISSHGDFDAFTMLAMTINYVEINGISFGRQLLLPLFFYVPRSIWLNKPVGSGYLVAQYFGGFGNVSSPLWAEGYINFGILGVIVFFYILGFISKKIDTILIAKKYDIMHKLIAVIFTFNQYILLRGDLNTGTNILFLFITFYLGWIVFRQYKLK